MPIDWKCPDSYKRLLAAMVAAQDHKVDFNKVAFFFGQGATYDAIEGRFRIAKKLATTLQNEADAEGRQMLPTRTKSATSTPRKPKAQPSIEGGVISGRVDKKTSPRKRNNKNNAASNIKIESDSSSSVSHTPQSVGSTESDLPPSYDGTVDDFSPYTMDNFTNMAGIYGLTPTDMANEL